MKITKALLAVAFLLWCSLSASAAEHIWLGTVSGRTSDPGNWVGGSPGGDEQAILIFPSAAARKSIVNDAADLRFVAIDIQAPTYVFNGLPLATNEGTVTASAEVVFASGFDVANMLVFGGGIGNVEVTGRIAGAGGVRIAKQANVGFGGSTPNSYAGETIVGSTLRLAKAVGVTSIPGNVRVIRADEWSGSLTVETAEQIANGAVVDLSEGGGLSLAGDESFATLRAGERPVEGVFATLTVGNLIVTSANASIETTLRIRDNELTIPAGLGIRVEKLLIGENPFVLRGAGRFEFRNIDEGRLQIEGPAVSGFSSGVMVRMSSGSFGGAARSIIATGGVLFDAESATDILLGSNVVVRAELRDAPSFRLNGILSLGNATLELTPDLNPLFPYTLIRNDSQQPVLGTFAGIREHGIAQNTFRVSYAGDSGNDVVLWRLDKPLPTVSVEQLPSPAIVGEPARLTITLSGPAGVPTGQVILRHRDGHVETATLKQGRVTTLVTPDREGEISGLDLTYSGDATYAGGVLHPIYVAAYGKPTITAIEPATGKAGELVDVVIRGTYFYPNATIAGVSATSLQRISATEIRARLALFGYTTATTLAVRVTTPGGALESDPFPFQVTVDPEPPSLLTFENATPTARVTPHAKTAWLTTILDPAFTTNFIVDADGDGVVQWAWATPTPQAVYSVVDLTSGDYAIRGYGFARANVEGFPAHSFARDENGNVTRLVLPLPDSFGTKWQLLWARPGMGAWTMTMIDGEDDDQSTRNRIIFATVSAATLQPLGDSTAPPAGFARGDVAIFLSIGGGGNRIYAARLDGELTDASPGVLDAAKPAISVHESAGVARLTVMRTGGASGPATLHYATLDRTAIAGIHYTQLSSTLTFAQGETIRTIDVPLLDDAIYRGEVAFDVLLSDATGATLGNANAFRVTLLDNEPQPALSFVGPEERHVLETDGPQPYAIELLLEGATALPATFDWTTSDPGQYGRVTFAPGATRKTLVVLLPGDDAVRGETQFAIAFQSIEHVTIATSPLRIFIDEDDAAPTTISITGSAASEGAAGTTSILTFEIRLSAASTLPVSVRYTTVDGLAIAGHDFEAGSGTITFAPGKTTRTIAIRILTDTLAEDDENLFVQLDEPVHATIVDALASATIVKDR